MPAKTQREREAEQRKQKLDRMKEQIDDGSLVVRKMSDAERKRFEKERASRPNPPSGAKKPRERRRRPPLSAR
ncbi:MAG TPA: hypothetical protein VFT42_03390 [Solirubrobacteraceae bacterium]|nr:hypothetical protein [Solirubrobacteraceae bacterium]